jgi:hypothetical protein
MVRVDTVIPGMRSDEANEDVRVSTMNDEPILVPADVEDDAPALENGRFREVPLDIFRRPPVGRFCFVVPRA